jgi:hypothetical protein
MLSSVGVTGLEPASLTVPNRAIYQLIYTPEKMSLRDLCELLADTKRIGAHVYMKNAVTEMVLPF